VTYLTDVAAIAITAIHPTMSSAIIAPRVIRAFSLNVERLLIFASIPIDEENWQIRKEAANRAGLPDAVQRQTIWVFPAASRVPVPKHPCFGRYFCASAAAGRDLVPSVIVPSALALRLLAARKAAAATNDTNGLALMIDSSRRVRSHATTPNAE
jgi:hypothetical protein